MSGENAFGSALKRGDGASPETFSAIANVTSISDVPNISVESLDSTAHDTPDGFRTYLPGLGDAGEISITIRFTPTDHEQLYTDATTKVVGNWQMEWPDGTTLDFSAFINALTTSAPHDGLQEGNVTFRTSGLPTLTVA